MMKEREAGLRLGVNLDHVATLRQARHTPYPDLREAIRIAEQAGADGITLHLREDRRHIQDTDMIMARAEVKTHLNMEMAATDEMVAIASRILPDYCCLVPERREELTTEGGLDVIAHASRVSDCCRALAECGIQVSLFIEPDERQLDMARRLGAPIVELHTGAYALAHGKQVERELDRLRLAVRHGVAIGLQVNAGHGLDYVNVAPIAAMSELVELNIGHSIVSQALFLGLGNAVAEMRVTMQRARAAAS